MWDELLAIADQQGGVFSAEQAGGFGIGREAIRRLLRDKALQSVRQSIYCATPLIESDPVARHRIQVAAALLARGNPTAEGRPTLVAGSLSAAVLLGLSIPRSLRDREAVTSIIGRGSGATPWVPRAIHLISGNRVGRTYRAGVHVCPAALSPEDVVTRLNVPMTSPARTASDLCRQTKVWLDAVIVADSALRRGADANELKAVAQCCSRWRGGKMAVRAANFADARAESAAESVARALFADHKQLTDFDLQVHVGDADGEIARVDFLFRRYRTIVEVDGRVKYVDPWDKPGDVLWEEKLREDRLRDAGFEVVRVTWHQLITQPERVIERILAAFARAERRAA